MKKNIYISNSLTQNKTGSINSSSYSAKHKQKLGQNSANLSSNYNSSSKNIK
jgi:hypothetical protein